MAKKLPVLTEAQWDTVQQALEFTQSHLSDYELASTEEEVESGEHTYSQEFSDNVDVLADTLRELLG